MCLPVELSQSWMKVTKRYSRLIWLKYIFKMHEMCVLMRQINIYFNYVVNHELSGNGYDKKIILKNYYYYILYIF